MFNLVEKFLREKQFGQEFVGINGNKYIKIMPEVYTEFKKDEQGNTMGVYKRKAHLAVNKGSLLNEASSVFLVFEKLDLPEEDFDEPNTEVEIRLDEEEESMKEE